MGGAPGVAERVPEERPMIKELRSADLRSLAAEKNSFNESTATSAKVQSVFVERM